MKVLSEHLAEFFVGKRVKIFDKSNIPHKILEGLIIEFKWEEINWEADIISILLQTEDGVQMWIDLSYDLEVEFIKT